MSSWGFDRAQMAYDNAVPAYLEDDDGPDEDAVEAADDWDEGDES